MTSWPSPQPFTISTYSPRRTTSGPLSALWMRGCGGPDAAHSGEELAIIVAKHHHLIPYAGATRDSPNPSGAQSRGT
jgi:hypothetical protein